MKPAYLLFLAFSFLDPPLSNGQMHDRELHPGLTFRRDFSTSTHRFNLKTHLTTPIAGDHREGIENSRRLARNAIKLGVDTQADRDLLAAHPPKKIFSKTVFDVTQPLPKDGPRIALDGSSATSLPFGDGPGFLPGFPKGTPDFWEGKDGPEKVWEIVACPVADTVSFLSDPLRCVLGIDTTTGSTSGSILDFFANIDGSQITTAMISAVVPIATEFVYNFSGLAWLETMLQNVCEILKLVDTISDIVKALGGGIKDIVGGIGNLFGFRNRMLAAGRKIECTGHLSTCAAAAPANCDACLHDPSDSPTSCPNCYHCFQPFHSVLPDMDGICLETEKLRDFLTAPAVSTFALESYYSLMTANYIKKKSSVEVLTAITDTKTSINSKIDLQCKKRRLGEGSSPKEDIDLFEELMQSEPSPKEDIDLFEELMQSEQAQQAKQYASSKGLKEDHVDEIFSKIVDGLSGETGNAFNEAIGDEVKKALGNPDNMELIEKILSADVEANEDMYTGKIISVILEAATDKHTRHLDGDALKDTISKLEDARQNRMRSLGLGSKCDDLIKGIKTFVKDTIITPLLTNVVTGLVAAVDGAGSAFDQVQNNPIYSAALSGLAGGLSASPLLMSFGFVQAFDPWSGVLGVVMSGIVKIFHSIAGFFLYGCDVFSPNCGDLPSLRNEVLSAIKQSRDGNIYMGGGCDSEFEGEMAYYAPALSIIDKLLDAAGDAVIEFFNIPIKIVQFILQAASLLFEHMSDVCDYLDSYVELALVEATHENSRYALQELACRNPFEPKLQLQRGYGCDGLDNTCDPDKRIDECDEDIFPPTIDASLGMDRCADKIYATSQDAIDCFLVPGAVSASDDCKKVDLVISDKGISPVCTGTVVVTATAVGCGGRIPEDVTMLEVEVDVDNDAPVVDCFIASQDMCGNGGFKNLLFSYTAVDGCTASADLAMSIEILSNELVEAGEEMVTISKPIAGFTNAMVPSIFVEDRACGVCKISSYPKNTRKYVVSVTATDKAGNVGTATCSTQIGFEDIDGKNPFFSLKKQDFIGGNTSHLPYNIASGCKDGKYYVDYPEDGVEFKCAKDCDPIHGLPCKGPAPDRSGVPVVLFDTAEECCNSKVFWIDEGTCVSDTNNKMPNPPLGSTNWWVNWKLDAGTCVQDCVGARPCGGVKSNFDPVFPSADKCCDSIPWKIGGCSL